jgi:PKD repeat protein
MKALKTLAATLATISLTACVVHKAEAPPSLSGPSGAATSVTLTASPDSISHDGGSQSRITVTVLGPNGRPFDRPPTLRLDTFVNGIQQDFGTLSARTIVPNAAGEASAVFTAPPTPPGSNFGTCQGMAGTCVEIVATPIGTSFEAASPQSVLIRLVPPGVIVAPGNTPAPCFTMSPLSAAAHVTLQFTAGTLVSNVCQAPTSDITAFAWTFGDGSSGSGRVVSHMFGESGSFNVTLTETSDRGLSGSTTQAITVGSASLPTPAFTFSPAGASVNETIFFNASTSAPGEGHAITSYRWTFGDGTTGSGVTVSHAFAVAGTYTVQLTVTDETGQSVTSAGTPISVGGGNPTAVLTVTKTGGNSILADGGGSTAAAGSTIVSYVFLWGDGTSNTTLPPTSSIAHTYAVAGTYTVRLNVLDNLGRSGTTTQTVTVP